MNYIIEKYKQNNIGGISDAEFRAMVIEYFLGEDWYVADSLSQTQVNQIALDEILTKHSKKYRQEQKQYIKNKEKLEALEQDIAYLKDRYFNQ